MRKIVKIIKKVMPQKMYLKIREKWMHLKLRKAVTLETQKIQENGIPESYELIDPKKLISSNRLDIVVRYLLFKDFCNEVKNPENESLYARTILYRTGAEEPVNEYSRAEKIGIDTHLDAAKKLYDGMKTNGFMKEYAIPIGINQGLFNGAHRLAAAIALDERVWIDKRPDNGIADFCFDWFKDNDFSVNDKIRIMRGFADLYVKCGIFCIWATEKKNWDYITKQIDKRVKVVAYADIDFSNNYIGFENIISDVYLNYNKDKSDNIQRKIEILKMTDLVIRVVLVSDEGTDKSKDLYEIMGEIKREIREKLHYSLDKGSYLLMHGSDSYAEFCHLRNLLLSCNNIKFVNSRVHHIPRYEFVDKLHKLEQALRKYKIPKSNVCIVSGGVLEAYGLRSSTDVDIIITSQLREQYKSGSIEIGDEIEIHKENLYQVRDDVIIMDDNYHFYYLGFKFANLELEFDKKKKDFVCSENAKTKRDIRLIQLYYDYSKYEKNQWELSRRISNEMEIRKKKKWL